MLHQSNTDQAGDGGFVGDIAARSLTRYVRGRMAGDATSSEFLDTMPFAECMDTCSLIGAIEVFGLEYGRASIRGNEDTWRATAAGFAIASAGEANVEAFLTERVRSAGLRLGYGLACFGSMHRRLATSEPEDRLLALKSLVIKVGHATGMIHYTTKEAYGMPVPSARFVGVNQAASIFKCNKRRLHSILIGMGQLDESSRELPEGKVAVDLDLLGPILSEIADAMTLKDAGMIIGVHPDHMSQLVDMGSIPVLYEYTRIDEKVALRHISRTAMTDYLNGVLEQANLLPAELAKKSTLCTINEIPGRIIKPRHLVLDLIARKQLHHVYSRVPDPTLADILVDTAEIVTFYDHREEDELDVEQAAELIGVSISTMRYLSKNGHLHFHIRNNPVNGRRQRTWLRDDLVAFEAAYISLGRLARASSKQCNYVMKRLRANDIVPAIDDAAAFFYRRADVRRCATKDVADVADCPVLPRRENLLVRMRWEKKRLDKRETEIAGAHEA